jgi:hypothetical protein
VYHKEKHIGSINVIKEAEAEVKAHTAEQNLNKCYISESMVVIWAVMPWKLASKQKCSSET